MQRIAAIIKLTWKAAFRYRLFWVLVALLLCSVVALPLVIKDDGTARGFVQILLTYTLGIITSLLGLATLWLSCGTLARDIEEAQMQMVAVKPSARWEIWLCTWIGRVLLNSALLAIAGGSVFFLLKWRAQKLPESEQTILRNEIFVARGSVKESVENTEPIVEAELRERLKQSQFTTLDKQLLRKQIEEQVKSSQQIVAPNYARRWVIDLGSRAESLRDQPLFLRVKFHSPESRPMFEPPTYAATWVVGPPESARLLRLDMPSMAAETFHEFEIPKNLFDESGKLTIEFRNYNKATLLFPVEDGMEVLYREAGFAVNFLRGMGIILTWLALLSAIGLCAASFLSFPVAAFFALGVLIVGMSSGTLSTVVEEGAVMGVDHESGRSTAPAVDFLLVPVFKGALHVVNLVQGFSPINALSTGRSITWGQLGLAFGQIVVLLGGIFAVVGIVAFSRRELATAQGNG